MTDGRLVHRPGYPNLRTLEIAIRTLEIGGTTVTQAGIDQLRTALPRLKVVGNG